MCPKAAFKAQGSRCYGLPKYLSTTLSPQHSCPDGKEARPAVLLANVQSRKSYKNATFTKIENNYSREGGSSGGSSGSRAGS